MLVLAGISSWFLPYWWVVAVVTGLCALYTFPSTNGVAFTAGFTSVSLLWLVYMLITTSYNQGILLSRIVTLLQLPSHWSLIVLTLAIGGTVGGMGAVCGRQLHDLFKKKERGNRVYR